MSLAGGAHAESGSGLLSTGQERPFGARPDKLAGHWPRGSRGGRFPRRRGLGRGGKARRRLLSNAIGEHARTILHSSTKPPGPWARLPEDDTPVSRGDPFQAAKDGGNLDRLEVVLSIIGQLLRPRACRPLHGKLCPARLGRHNRTPKMSARLYEARVPRARAPRLSTSPPEDILFAGKVACDGWRKPCRTPPPYLRIASVTRLSSGGRVALLRLCHPGAAR